MYPSSMLMRYTPSEMSDAAYYFKYVFQAIEQNDLLGLKKIIRSSRAVMELADAYSNTPLLYACYRGRKDHLLYLLSKGANPHCINIFGKYPYSTKKTNDLELHDDSIFILFKVKMH